LGKYSSLVLGFLLKSFIHWIIYSSNASLFFHVCAIAFSRAKSISSCFCMKPFTSLVLCHVLPKSAFCLVA